MQKEWYQTWFNHLYPKLYPHRNLEESSAQVESLLNFIDLKERKTCLDIACGTGRHVKFLSKNFGETTGIDLSKDLIEIGKDKGYFDNASAHIRDMRQPELESEYFNLVCNFFTGFGYFKTDIEHQSLIDTWLDLVAKDGILFIDYLNKENVIKNLVSESEKKIDKYFVKEKRQINLNRVEKTIEITSKGSDVQTYEESVLMYSKDEMNNFLSKASEVSFYGDYSWSEFSDESPRMLIVIKK